MNRRYFLAGSVSALAGCSAADLGLHRSPAKAPTAVLVHGAWHGGWCWQPVESRLRSAGWQVCSPTLTGLGARAHLRLPPPTLSTHIEDVTRLIEWRELNDVVLVGHSYAGMIITAVADRLPDRIRHVIYLDAALPDDRQNMITQNPAISGAAEASIVEQLKSLTADGIWMRPFPATTFGIPAEQTELLAWVNRRLTDHPLPTWTEPVRLLNGGSAELPRTYLHCTNPVLPRASFAAHAERIQGGLVGLGWRYQELATGHDAMLTAPDQVAREIIQSYRG